jgi:hypothetical protein
VLYHSERPITCDRRCRRPVQIIGKFFGLVRFSSMTRWTNVIAAIAAASLAGCVADDGADGVDQAPDPRPDPEQKATSKGFYTWERVTNLPAVADFHAIGSTADKTCFLAGLFGSMRNGYGQTEPSGTLYGPSAAGVIGGDGSTYQLEAAPGVTGWNLGMNASCTSLVAGRSQLYYFDSDTNTHAVKMAAKSPSSGVITICGLTEVKQPLNTYQDFGTVDDELRVLDGGDGYWYLGGAGHAAGYAQCVEVNARTSSDYSADSGIINLSQGAGKQCFLTGLKGVWQSNDFGSGIWLAYDADLLQWTMTVTDSGRQRGYARCLD